jgi:flagellar secretion chaperone FliS
MDDSRSRFLQDRVLTATPGQRIVMLFDRLLLDLTRASTAAPTDPIEIRRHAGHASQIVAELMGSLDPTAGGPVDNLLAIYGYLLNGLTGPDLRKVVANLPSMLEIVTALRATWVLAVEKTDRPAQTSGAGKVGNPVSDSPVRALAGSWVG